MAQSVGVPFCAVVSADEEFHTRSQGMTTPPSPAVAIAAVSVLVVSNYVSNRVLPRAWYVPWNTAVSLGMVALAVLWDRQSWRDIGAAEWRRGLRWGSAMAAGTAVVYLVGLAIPATRELFDDDRAQRDLARLLLDAFVAVPLGTVLLEEVAFRGVLPAVFEKRWGPRVAVGGSAALFGLWHVLPSWTVGSANAAVRGLLPGIGGRLLTVAGAVTGTAAVGVGFSWLRRRSGSLLAPMVLHTSTNSLAYLIAWAFRRWRG